jgi:hypothetical protein
MKMTEAGKAPPHPPLLVLPLSSDQLQVFVSLLQLQREVDDLRRGFAAYHADLHQRLQESEATVAALRTSVMTITSSSSAIDCLTRALADAVSGVDDDDHRSSTELFELRRWKQQYSIEQTRNLVERCDQLTQQNAVLSERLRAALQCPRCGYRVCEGVDGSLR